MPSRLFILLALLTASPVFAEDRPAGPPAPPRDPLFPPSPAPAVAGSRWSLEAGQWSVYDSNIDHVNPPRSDYGVVFMGAGAWQNRVSKPTLALRYEGALHRYTHSTKWNRFSQRAEADFEKRISKRWITETRAEISLKGSSEDRELSNQYSILQMLDYRIVRGLELRLFGLARLKRYPAPDQGREATNAYAGPALRARLGGARLELSTRYEYNAARDQRRDYERWVHAVGLLAPFGRSDALDLGVKFYDQQYPFRVVDDGAAQGQLRKDQRLVVSASWMHRFREDLGLELAYKLDGRRSNELDKGYDEHQAAVSFVYRFDRPRNRPLESTPAH
jgi:hypothetical protein